ncbi:hypothetical protein F6S84_08690 [Bifidobacterium dentium]|nr:hypothetical protein [Bifidobacterium dentium]NEG53722.1 hypothetical protein [Bifidobacterium dentium]
MIQPDGRSAVCIMHTPPAVGASQLRRRGGGAENVSMDNRNEQRCGVRFPLTTEIAPHLTCHRNQSASFAKEPTTAPSCIAGTPALILEARPRLFRLVV